MSVVPAARIALVTEDRSARMLRREWQGRKASPAAMEMVALHIRKSQIGFGIVAVGMASLVALAACLAPFAFI